MATPSGLVSESGSEEQEFLMGLPGPSLGPVWASPPSIMDAPAGTSTVPKLLTPGAFQPGIWEELTALLVSEDLGKATNTYMCACMLSCSVVFDSLQFHGL